VGIESNVSRDGFRCGCFFGDVGFDSGAIAACKSAVPDIAPVDKEIYHGDEGKVTKSKLFIVLYRVSKGDIARLELFCLP
jgi:hypothetical protein